MKKPLVVEKISEEEIESQSKEIMDLFETDDIEVEEEHPSFNEPTSTMMKILMKVSLSHKMEEEQ